jgi:hypothetical protein
MALEAALRSDEQPALELVLVRHARAAADEHLTHGRLDSLHRLAEIGIVDGPRASPAAPEPSSANTRSTIALHLREALGVRGMKNWPTA